jgi:hypothetical protein
VPHSQATDNIATIFIFNRYLYTHKLFKDSTSIAIEPGTSVGIVSDYGLDDRAIEVRSPAGERIFPVTSVSRPALASTQPPAQWVPGVLSPGLKRGRGVTLITHPYLVSRSRMSRSYTSSPPCAFMASSGTALAFSINCYFMYNRIE